MYPQIIPCLIGFGTMFFTIHFGGFPLFLVQHPYHMCLRAMLHTIVAYYNCNIVLHDMYVSMALLENH